MFSTLFRTAETSVTSSNSDNLDSKSSSASVSRSLFNDVDELIFGHMIRITHGTFQINSFLSDPKELLGLKKSGSDSNQNRDKTLRFQHLQISVNL